MARGQQAVQSQQKNAKKKEKERKRLAAKGTHQPGKLTEAALAKSAKCKVCSKFLVLLLLLCFPTLFHSLLSLLFSHSLSLFSPLSFSSLRLFSSLASSLLAI